MVTKERTEQVNQVEVNVEKIMEEINLKALQEEAKKMPSFDSMPLNIQSGMDSNQILQYLRENHAVQYYKPVVGNRLVSLVKRVIRRLARCVVLPVVEDQNKLNQQTVCCLEHVMAELNNCREQNQKLMQRIQQLEKGE